MAMYKICDFCMAKRIDYCPVVNTRICTEIMSMVTLISAPSSSKLDNDSHNLKGNVNGNDKESSFDDYSISLTMSTSSTEKPTSDDSRADSSIITVNTDDDIICSSGDL